MTRGGLLAAACAGLAGAALAAVLAGPVRLAPGAVLLELGIGVVQVGRRRLVQDRDAQLVQPGLQLPGVV